MIRSRRSAHLQITQLELSQRLAALGTPVTVAAISDWERGVSTPRQHLQLTLCQALDVEWSSIFSLDGLAS